MNNPYSAVIVAGGTGGHLYPGVAVARELQSSAQRWEILFVVREGDRGKELLRRENFTVAEIKGQGMPRSFNPFLWLTFPFKVLGGFLGAFYLLRQTKPRIVLGMGGYLTFPVLLAARLLGIRSVIHEQNVYPGLANRLSSRLAQEVAISFDESRQYFPLRKTRLSGLPARLLT